MVQLVKEQHHIETGYVVGDRASGINAAQHNQLKSIGVRFDFAQDSELAQANYIVEDFIDILNIVERCCRKSKLLFLQFFTVTSQRDKRVKDKGARKEGLWEREKRWMICIDSMQNNTFSNSAFKLLKSILS
ncbi:HAD hydrolase-like protein [Metasolibacillus meyeri]|uniref:HAD hydrolase-like protein n=1 Tax=Metasolibacillus meyeri TaxID=1071052 RepID=UPI001EE69426|nr:HAD hydrolase-like protein [Metasolibacillus meyeri]